MEQELLKWIEGYEGLYIITSYGRVFSVIKRDRYSRIMGGGEVKQQLTGSQRDYRFVVLYKNGKGKQFYVHQLVAKAFIPNPDNKPQVDHIDNNKENNNVSNLKWVTQKENMNNTITRARMLNESYKYISQVGEENPFSRKVAVYDLNDNFVGVYGSGGQAIRALGLPKNTDVGRVARGERPQTHGYVFKYLSEQKMKIQKRPKNAFLKKKIQQLDLEGNVVAEYESIQAAYRATGFHYTNIGKAANGILKTFKGYKWRFK